MLVVGANCIQFIARALAFVCFNTVCNVLVRPKKVMPCCLLWRPLRLGSVGLVKQLSTIFSATTFSLLVSLTQTTLIMAALQGMTKRHAKLFERRYQKRAKLLRDCFIRENYLLH